MPGEEGPVTMKPDKKKEHFQSVTKGAGMLDGFIPGLNEIAESIQKEIGVAFRFDTAKLAIALRETKQDLVEKCIMKLGVECPTVYINENMLTRIGFYMRPFNGKVYMDHIRSVYAEKDLITLEQIRYAILDEMVVSWSNGHYHEWDKKTPDMIEDINTAGIELYFRGNRFTDDELLDAVIKFCRFVLGEHEIIDGKRTPAVTELEGMPITLKEFKPGRAYYGINEIYSVMYFNGKTHSMKINFNNPEDRQKFKDLLFSPTWKLMNYGEPEQKPFRDVCDICLFKDVSSLYCDQCVRYSHWVGSCLFCSKNNKYPRYRGGECDVCKTGVENKFTPILSVSELPGLVEETGYYYHIWTAEPFQVRPYVQTMCLEIRYKFRNYRGKYRAHPCMDCRASITSHQEGEIRQRCDPRPKRESYVEKYYVYNSRGVMDHKRLLGCYQWAVRTEI
jgi:hypothetical protein